MGSYPTSPRAAFLDWCYGHIEIFTDNAAAIGLTPAQALAFKNATEAAKAVQAQQTLARQALDALNIDTSAAFDTLRTRAGDTVRLIRAFAEVAADPNAVYSTAQIPPPAAATPLPPPAQPTDLRVELDAASGLLTLRWKAANPPGGGGTSYLVRRRLPGESEFTFIGASGAKKYIDTTLLAGPDMVQYTVQGQRSGEAGPLSPVFTVNFGRAPDGSRVANVGGVANEVAPSTVNGRMVQKSLPNGNGRPAPSRS